jgi:hypothetical protein
VAMICVTRGGEVAAGWWLLATMVATRQVCGIIFPCAVVAGILSVGMQGNEGDGLRMIMMATIMAKTGGC